MMSSLRKQVRRIETELAEARQAERIARSRLRAELVKRMKRPSTVVAGLAGAAVVGYLVVPGEESADGGEPRRSPWLEKLVDQAFLLLRSLVVASVTGAVPDEP